MKRDEVDVIQLALPVAGANDAQVLNNLRQEVASLQEAWTGQRPSAIPMVPEELTEADFYNFVNMSECQKNEYIPIGLDTETTEAVHWQPRIGPLVYIAKGEEQMVTMTNYLTNISRLFEKDTIILAPTYHFLSDSEESVMLLSAIDEVK